MAFKRALGPFDATMVVVGGIIGAGIFINPYIVAQRLDTGPLVLAAWIVGGLVALCGALTFAELGSLQPEAGGHYAYLRDAYHPLAGFMYGWGLLLIIETGAIAAVAITFAEYALRFVGREGAAGGAAGGGGNRRRHGGQLLRRRSRQPVAERIRAAEGGGARAADRRRVVHAGARTYGGGGGHRRGGRAPWGLSPERVPL